MKNKNELNSKKGNDNFSSLRVKTKTKSRALKLLESANKKEFGRKVSIDDLITIALENVSKEQVQLLQKKSLRNKDRQAIVYQFYCKKVNKITEDEFIGVTMSPEYFTFLDVNKRELSRLGI